MAKVVHLTHDYEYEADLVWSILTEFKHLETVMEGLATFKGLPEGQIFEGQKLSVEVSMFGKLPFQPYFMSVEHCDHKAFTFISSEKGAGVRSWRHSLSVVSHNSGPTYAGGSCQVIENIEIDAGSITFIFALWAKCMYSARHKRRLAILKQFKLPITR